MLTSLEKTPGLDAVCSNFLAQVLNISGDRNISFHQWDKCTAEGNGDWLSGWIWPRLFSCWWFEQPLVVTRWFRNSGATVRLTRCHQRAQTSIRHQRHTIKARRKSFQQLIKGAGLERHWLFLFTCFLVLHVIISKKVCILPPLGSALL